MSWSTTIALSALLQIGRKDVRCRLQTSRQRRAYHQFDRFLITTMASVIVSIVVASIRVVALSDIDIHAVSAVIVRHSAILSIFAIIAIAAGGFSPCRPHAPIVLDRQQQTHPPQLLPQDARLQLALSYQRGIRVSRIAQVRPLARTGVGDVVERYTVSDQMDGFVLAHVACCH